jgi:hypothetical protein
MKRFFLVTMVIGFSACIPAQAQLGGLVYDPTQAAHAIEQIAQGENILQNTIQLAQTSLAYYQLAYQMSIAPQSVYAGWTSPSTYWQLLEMTANTYGNSEPVMASANSGAGADAAYQMASVPRYGPVPEYPTLSLQGQQQIAATGASSDISDAIVGSSLTTLGTMRGNEIEREQDIENLEAESQTTDPLQMTDMATLQRINQGVLLQIRQSQEANQLQQTIALHQMIAQKEQQDAIKSKFQDAADYGTNFQSQIAPAYNGADAAMTY